MEISWVRIWGIMGNIPEQNKMTLMSCIEIVLMRFGNTSFHWVQAKLNTSCNCTTKDCYDCPEMLRTALKEVYHDSYDYVIKEIKLELGELANADGIAQFLKVLSS